MTKEQTTKEIKKLVAKLESSTDQSEKRKLRAQLRSLGHKGGLGKKAPAKKTTTRKAAAKKAPAKKKVAKKKVSRRVTAKKE